MKKLHWLHWIEYPEIGHCLSVGRNAPWMNKYQIKLPVKIIKFLLKITNNDN